MIICGACCACKCVCGKCDLPSCNGECLPGGCTCHCDITDPGEGEGGSGNFRFVIEGSVELPDLPEFTFPEFNFNFTIREVPPLEKLEDFTFERPEYETLEGFELPRGRFAPYDFGEEEENDVKKSELTYFERTGDYGIRLKFDAVFNDLTKAIGSHLPVDFARRFYEATSSGRSAADLPLKFGFNFTLFEGQPYAVSVRTPEFNLADYFEKARKHDFVPVMRALLLVLLCLYFVLEMFNLVFRIS